MSNITARKAKFIAIYSVAFVFLAIIGYAISNSTLHANKPAPEVSQTLHFASDVTYISLPSIKFSVASRDSAQPVQVRMDISLEVEKKNLGHLQDYESILINRIMNYVRGMDASELRQRSAVPRLRQALLQEVNTSGLPSNVLNLVFRQLVIL